MKASSLFIFVLFTLTAYSQNSINNYKYVIVPEKFDMFKINNQYGLNTLAQSLLKEKGFTAFMSNEQWPPEVAANKCNALRTEVEADNGLFVTKLTLLLKDCQGNIIFKSKEGKSREKDFHAAYSEALRNAFSSLKDVPYNYDSTTLTQPPQAVVTPVAAAPTPASATAPVPATGITGVLYAQATSNGYQLIDTTPKKVLTLFNTSLQDHFIAEAGTSTGIVFKRNEEWFFEYYKDNKLVTQKLQIKF